jgi:hypothetical protein
VLVAPVDVEPELVEPVPLVLPVPVAADALEARAAIATRAIIVSCFIKKKNKRVKNGAVSGI